MSKTNRNPGKCLAATAAAIGAISAGSVYGQGLIQIEEVVVTAQKRTESLQDVPSSISVVDEKFLRNVTATQLVDYAGYVSGLQVDNNGSPGQTTISLRGITPIGTNATVGTYLDDAPVGSSTVYANSGSLALDLMPYDIQRIEVLRGPQGTLYGSSAIGGLLKYVTRLPDLSSYSARAGTEVFSIEEGDDLGYGAQAMINAPIVADRLGITASYAYRKTPGYVDSAQTGDEDQNRYLQQSAHVSGLWKPTDQFSARLSGLWQQSNAHGFANIAEDLLTGQPIADGLSNNNFDREFFRQTPQFFGATLDYDFGFANLESVSTYSRIKTERLRDTARIYGALYPLFGLPPGLAPYSQVLDLRKFTQEVRLTSPGGGRTEWLVGVFYTRELNDNNQVIRAQRFDGTFITGLDPLLNAQLPSEYQEYAVFGNATHRFSEAFDISVGLRLAKNEQAFKQIGSGALVGPPVDAVGESDETVFTYNFSTSYHFNPATMLYARVASGYQPGGPNALLPGAKPVVDFSTLTNYELGLKTTRLDGRLSLDMAAFYMDWQDIQLLVSSGGTSFLDNAGSAVSKGFEATATIRATEGLRLVATGAYTEAELTENAPSVGGRDGDRLPRVPQYAGSLIANHEFALSNTLALRLGAGLRAESDRFAKVESAANNAHPRGYSVFDVSAELASEGSWTVKLYARNVTDKRADITQDVVTTALGTPVYMRATPLEPRVIGLALETSF